VDHFVEVNHQGGNGAMLSYGYPPAHQIEAIPEGLPDAGFVYFKHVRKGRVLIGAPGFAWCFVPFRLRESLYLSYKISQHLLPQLSATDTKTSLWLVMTHLGVLYSSGCEGTCLFVTFGRI